MKTLDETIQETKKEAAESSSEQKEPRVVVIDTKAPEPKNFLSKFYTFLQAIWGSVIAAGVVVSSVITWWLSKLNHQHDMESQKRNHEHDMEMMKARFVEEAKSKNPANVVMQEIVEWPKLSPPTYKLPYFKGNEKSSLLVQNDVLSAFIKHGKRNRKEIVKLAITGPPGVGKSMIVKEAGYTLQQDHGMKVIYIALKDTEQASPMRMMQQHFGLQFIPMPDNGTVL